MDELISNILFVIVFLITLWMGLLLRDPVIPILFVVMVIVARKRNRGGS